MASFSAYLSIYNDWDILETALRSIKGRIKELIVVDGGFDWMAPYLKACGKDPLRSDHRLYDVISDSGIPTRVISKSWPTEIEKRKAGYAACTTSHIFRIDADEVLFFNDDAFERALASKQPISEMDMPLYDSPGYVHAKDQTSAFGRQPLLFDARQIGAEEHLQYLWLVLTADRLPGGFGDRMGIFNEPIAFNAHLSTWRSSQGRAQRAAFYWMNWMRENGCPYVPDLAGQPMENVSKVLDFIPAETISSALSRSDLANGNFRLIGEVLRPSPLSNNQEQAFASLYEKSMVSSFSLNDSASEVDQAFFTGANICFNISDCGGARSLVRGPRINLRTNGVNRRVRAELRYVNSCPPFTKSDELDVEIDGNDISILLPGDMIPKKDELRCVLTVSIWPASGSGFGSFRIV